MASFIEKRDDYWILKDDAGYGNALALKKAWSSRYLDLITKHKIKIIRLNEYTGWRGSDVSFLLTIPGINGVDILSDRVTDVSPLFAMKRLKTLSLYCKAKLAGDFAKLQHLQSVGLGWRNAYISIFELTTLTRLNILRYPKTDLTGWKCNSLLKKISISSGKLKRLTGIERFPNLRELELFYCPKLECLDAITPLRSVQRLRLGNCPRILDLSAIANLPELRELEVENCRDIRSLAPIVNCTKLTRLQIAGNTTIIDGDFRVLLQLPMLRKVLLAKRKHYSHTDDELEKK